MDDQLIELCGKHRLTESLLGAGLEVAFPARDRGIDLIAYADIDRRLERFAAVPIQMKAASEACFSIDRKYSKFHDMLIAYVWNLSEPANTQIYVLTQKEAVDIATEMKYTATESWTGKGVYVVTRPGRELIEKLRPHVVSRGKWQEKILGKAGDIKL
ncbi:MAG: hypothetical protein WB952_00895 [Terriglobales bacterium]